MQRASCIAGRATTYWKAYPEGQPETPLVIKDLWQCPERDEEGELLCEVAAKGVVNTTDSLGWNLTVKYAKESRMQYANEHQNDIDAYQQIPHALAYP